MTVPVLGHPPFEESYLSLANQSSPVAKQGEVKGSRGSTPTRERSFVSLMVYGPKVSYSALAMGGYSF